MASRASYEGPEEALARYEALVAGNVDVDRKGAKVPYTSRNGHMFSFLDGAGTMALRLPRDLRKEFLGQYDAKLVEQYGRVMPEFVAVPDSLLGRTGELQVWFDASHAWIGTLKPKPTTRAKPKKT